jgi:hypothetical protein
MVNLFRFLAVNLGVSQLVVRNLIEYLHYPPDLPVRIQASLPALMLALCFSLLAPAGVRLAPQRRPVRALLTLVAALLSLALSGVLWASSTRLLDPEAGVEMAFWVALHSPTLSLGLGLWALLWTQWSFPPIASAPPPEPKAAPADWEALAEPAGEWIGSTR